MTHLTLANTGIPEVPTKTTYATPEKRIHDSRALQNFQQSTALSELQQSLGRIVALVEGKDIPDGVFPPDLLYSKEDQEKYSHDLSVAIPVFEKAESKMDTILKEKPYVKAIVDLIGKMSDLVDQVPPFPGPRRYGNMACREWHTKLEESIDGWMTELIVPFYNKKNVDGFVDEVKWYIVNAFGSKERLDYGTGHELAYLAFLTGLWKVRVFGDDVNGEDFLIMFGVYYNLVRNLILTYTLEPAGSHGVWGLDDHFHIIYILGASQMLGSDSSKNGPAISPKLVSNKSVVYQYSSRNMYFNAVAFIYKVKKGAFFEHSPILYDVSNVKSWEKILKGMLKMYQAEVFGKFPVVQHFYFGGVLFPWTNAKTGQPLPIGSSEDSPKEPTKHQSPPTSTIPMTESPWKTPAGSSFQENVIKAAPGRAPPLGETTRAPWASGSGSTHGQPSTRAPWATRQAQTSASSSQQPPTRAPWAK